jgi:hypothetical protein
MLRTVTVLALLFSAQAFACPNLTGSYTCKAQDGSSSTLVLSQTLTNGVTTYSYAGSSVVADNKAYPIPDDANLKGGTQRAWCADDVTLTLELLGKYWNNGAYFGDLKLDLAVTKAGVDLKQVSTGNITNTGGTYPINNDMTCTKTP